MSDSAPFVRFAEAADRIAATTKRNEKAAILGEYFSVLSDRDLAIAARFFAGQIFPQWDQRTTNVGGSLLFGAISEVSGVDKDRLSAMLVPLGDLGALAFHAFSDSARRIGADSITLDKVQRTFDQFAATSGSKGKASQLSNILRQASPLETKYLVKLLAGDLRIGLKEGSVEDAIAKLAGKPVAEVQWANMLTGDVGETALLARRGALADARMRLFHPIRFMLATPAADLNDIERHMPRDFFVEDKFDGIRGQAHIAPAERDPAAAHGVVEKGVRVALFSRTLDEITGAFPDLVQPLAELVTAGGVAAEGLVMDGEIVPMRGGKVLPFLKLQKRLGRKKLPPKLLEQVPVVFMAFDVLYGNGKVLINEPLSNRRRALDSLTPRGRALRAESRLARGITGLDDEFAAARARGNEGLMVKSPESPYKPGRRGRDWLKIKRALATLDVVVTAVEVGHGRRSHLLSDYTFAVRASETDPALLNVGKAYSGLTDEELQRMSEWFKAHTLNEFAHGRVRIVEPRIVLEVTFDLVQPSTRHKSGYALRFPRILRLRNDKPPEEIDTLETVRRLAEGLPHEQE